MPSIDRPLAATALHYQLDPERLPDLIDGELLASGGRSARTLVKDGPLRVTLVSLAAGGALASHRAAGPITVHVLSGALRFTAGESVRTLAAGDLLALGAGIEHAVESADGADFLLTVATARLLTPDS